MRFDLYPPCDSLKAFVKTFVVSENADPNVYKVLPNTEVVLGFQYRGALWQVDEKGKQPLTTSGITGLHDRFRLFENSADVGTILVYFKEAGAATFFRQPIHELFRQSISLDNFLLRSELLLVEEQLYDAKTDEKKISIVEQFLLSRLREPVLDNLVLAALALIYKSKGTVRINDLARQLHTSQSPLEKRFRSIVGTTPKKFASIVRFRHICQHYRPEQSLTELGYESGFYDQAHFIKEFRAFTGKTPDGFFSPK